MGLGDNTGILCMGTVVKERNQGSEESCTEHVQSSQKERERPHDKVWERRFYK